MKLVWKINQGILSHLILPLIVESIVVFLYSYGLSVRPQNTYGLIYILRNPLLSPGPFLQTKPLHL